MRALSKTFLLLLATFGLASCGGGGGGSQSAFNATPVDSIAISAVHVDPRTLYDPDRIGQEARRYRRGRWDFDQRDGFAGDDGLRHPG